MTNDNRQRVTVFMNPSIAIQARAQAVIEKLTLTGIIEKALLNYLPKETIIKKIDISETIDRQ